VSELGECVLRAMKGRQTPHGIAMAVEAEVVEPLRARVDEVERKYVFDTAELKQRVDQLRASAEGAHRRINEVLDYLAGKDAVKLSEDAGAMGFHIVAVLDSPPRSDEEAPVRPALPWASLLTDAEASDLVSELASLFLDYWRGDRPDDVATLREVGRLLAEHRDRAARELAQVTAEVPHAAPCRYPSSPKCTCGTPAAALAVRLLDGRTDVASARPVDEVTLDVTVQPADLDGWEWWRTRVHAGASTFRGSYATAKGRLGLVTVLLTGVGVGALYAAERDRVGGESS
jgi:hypothetical protein